MGTLSVFEKTDPQKLTAGILGATTGVGHQTRVLVLGASGFVGRWVSRFLCRERVRPYLMVRDVEFAEQVFSAYEINGEIVRTDLQQLASVGEIIRKIKPAIVFNLAGYGVDRFERQDATAYRINAELIEVICRAMAGAENSWEGQQLVHVGSALEYGEISGNLAEDSTCNPTTVYGKSKLMGTDLLSQHCRKLGVRGITARLFTVYGPGEHNGRLLPSLLQAASNEQSLPLTLGTQKRDFTYVEDVAEGLLRLCAAESQPGEVVNLATGQLTTVRGFVETAASILNIPEDKLQFGAVQTRSEEMQHDPVSIDRLRRLVDWTPTIEIAEGIQRTKSFEQVGLTCSPQTQETECESS